jgi:DNA-binding GntR family transcriptional regulator
MALPKKNLKEDFQKLIVQLESMILTGVFQPRERLVELKLSEELGVSRFWIRDAFKILETKGLIKVIPYKGAVVCDLDEQEIEQIFEVRQELDALATRKAAQNVKKADLNFLKRMAQQFEKSVRRADFGEMMKTRGHILRYYAWSSLDAIKRIQREHRLLIKGLEKKDFKLLDDLARRHISYSKDSYLMHLKAKKANSLNPSR